MPRKKVEFKAIGTLPKGEWRLIQHAGGGIIAACSEHAPILIADGKMKTLETGENHAPQED